MSIVAIRALQAGYAILALGLIASCARAAEPWERFIGEYQGQAVTDTGGVVTDRDLEVVIGALDPGFSVSWTSVTRRADGRVKRKQYSIDFRPSRRKGVYESAMRKDLFGNRTPLDPMRGDPYVWARINGDTLSVFSLLITDDGGYDMQVYHRTLVEGGIALRYSRFAEGEQLRTVEGLLRRR